MIKIQKVAGIKISIGKSEKNDIVLKNPFLAERHVELFIDENSSVYLTDLKSSSGTFVNDKKLVGFIKLQEGDEVFLGNGHLLDWEQIVYSYLKKSNKGDFSITKKRKASENDNRSFLTKNLDVFIIYLLVIIFAIILIYSI